MTLTDGLELYICVILTIEFFYDYYYNTVENRRKRRIKKKQEEPKNAPPIQDIRTV